MEAETIEELPTGKGWLFEPKYDGFRCLAFRVGKRVNLQSRNQKPLERYFPELCVALAKLRHHRFVLDGEIIIPDETFEDLQLRLHPATSRVAELSRTYPAQLVVFDLLAVEGRSLVEDPLKTRRRALEQFMRSAGKSPRLALSKATRSIDTARRWLNQTGFDGLMVKALDQSYQPGRRAVSKFKIWKTVDCVVAGVYRKEVGGLVDSLLLGLYDDDGLLHYVGRSRIGQGAAEITKALKPLEGGPGFTGRAPGGKSRWTGKERKPVPIKPDLVVEVSADHITSNYMRHGSRILRWRDDKAPAACKMDQLRNLRATRRQS